MCVPEIISMKIRIRLYGYFSNNIPSYDPDLGTEVELPGSPTVEDLLAHLNIKASDGVVAIMAGRALSANEKIPEGKRISVFPVAQGG